MPRNSTWEIIAIILISWPLTRKAEISNMKPGKLRIVNSFYKDHPQYYNSLNKVSFTQKGYIQFLRYIADVPIITEFTFCIWLRSANLTYAHPLLSYSQHEEERYIRAWISPHGREINLAILENEVFKIPAYFRENHWYHICQSWDTQEGSWSFYLNGKLKLNGYKPKLRDLIIPAGGDIVVGQEYTDFDKGLDDGIEGDIFGFNLVLASTTTPREVTSNFIAPYELGERRILTPNYDLESAISYNKLPPTRRRQQENQYPFGFPNQNSDSSEEVPFVLSYFTTGTTRSPRTILEMSQDIFQSLMEWLEPKQKIQITAMEEFNVENDRRAVYYQNLLKRSVPSPERANKRIISGGSRIVNDIAGVNHKPLGLQLVELSHNCALGKGAPINHEKVLVSWTKTPVRVFGGAILKNVMPFCSNT